MRRLRLPHQAGRSEAVSRRGQLGPAIAGRAAAGRARRRTRAPGRSGGRACARTGAGPAHRALRRWSGCAGPHDRRIRRHALGQAAHPQGRAQHGAGAHPRRIGHRQGVGGQRHPWLQPPQRRAVRAGQLRRHPREPARSRVLRRAQGLLHRRHAGPRGLLPGRARRHAVSRRDRRPAAGHAGQAAARHPGAARARAGRHAGRAGGRAHRQRHPQGPGGRGAGRALPAGLVLPPERDRDRGAAAARAPRRPARAVPGAADAHRHRGRHPRAHAVAPPAGRAAQRTAGRQRARTGEPAAPRRGAGRGR